VVDYCSVAPKGGGDGDGKYLDILCIKWRFHPSDCESHRVSSLLLDLSEVIFAAKTFGIEFVDILRAGRPGGEPSTIRNHLDATECDAIARSTIEFRADLFAGEFLNIDLIRRLSVVRPNETF